jgi:glycerol-3-phosphate dehydrogenase
MPPGLHSYGSEQPLVQQLPGARTVLAPGLTEAMVRFAARHEYARTRRRCAGAPLAPAVPGRGLARAWAAVARRMLRRKRGLTRSWPAFEALARAICNSRLNSICWVDGNFTVCIIAGFA